MLHALIEIKLRELSQSNIGSVHFIKHGIETMMFAILIETSDFSSCYDEVNHQ